MIATMALLCALAQPTLLPAYQELSLSCQCDVWEARLILQAPHAAQYLALASLAGVSPGTCFPGGVTLPLNLDQLSYDLWAGLLPNFTNFGVQYVYDPGGVTVLSFRLAVQSGLLGIEIYAAVLVNDVTGYRVTKPARIRIVP